MAEGLVNEVPMELLAEELGVGVKKVKRMVKVVIGKVEAAERLTSGR